MLERLSDRVVLMWGWRRWAIALVAGALSALSMAPYHLFPVLWLSFPVLVWLIDGAGAMTARGRVRRIRPAFAIGWWFGFGYFLAGLWWVGLAFLVEADTFAWMMPFAVVLLPAGLALFWGLATAVSALMWRDGWRRIPILTVTLTAAEWLRGHVLTGFPWNTLGYALAPNAPFMQAASLVGLYGLTAAAVLVFSAPAVLAAPRDGQRSGVFLALCLALFAALPLYGFARLVAAPAMDAAATAGNGEVRLRIVQPAIAQKDKWRPEKAAEIFKTYLELSNRATSPDRPGVIGVTHLIWPESAFPFLLTRQPGALTALAELLPPGTVLITGALRELISASGEREAIYNSVFVIDDNGVIRDAYDKVHLVPFGEYLPLGWLLSRLGLRKLVTAPAGFAAGSARRALKPAFGPAFSPLICYEAIFPGAVLPPRNEHGKRPLWILNVTNDAWFGNTPGPAQHFDQVRLRSVEQGLPLVRAANTGISAVIDGFGRVRASLPLGARGVIDATLPAALDTTLYGRIGDLAILGILLILLGTALIRRGS